MQAYSGNGKFIFVSYAHKDSNIVYPFIEQLQKRFNVWYDDGIHLGRDYTEDIMSHLRDSSLFLFMVSKNSMESDFCKKEISFAERRGKSFINIIIEDFNVPDWFDFSYGHLQSFFLFKYSSIDDAIKDLYRKANTWFDLCTSDVINNVAKNKEEPEKIVEEAPNDKKVEKAAIKEETEQESILETVEEDDPSSYLIRNSAVCGYYGKSKNLRIPDGVTKINLCSIDSARPYAVSIYLPASLKEIPCYQFPYFSKLLHIDVDPNNPNYKSIDGILYSKDGTILYCYPAGKSGTFKVPDHVKTIKSTAFKKGSLSMIIIPENVSIIEPEAFAEAANLTSIEVDSNNNFYKSIDGILYDFETKTLIAFPSKKELKTYTSLRDVTKIAKCAFAGAFFLKTITLTNVVQIEDEVIRHSAVETFNVSNCSTRISSSAFQYAKNLININVEPGNMLYSSIDGVLFSKDQREINFIPNGRTGEYKVPESVTKIGFSAFKQSDLSRIILPQGLLSVGSFAFDSCYKLESIVIPDKVTIIDNYAFCYCRLLEKVVIGSSITEIKSNVFSSCDIVKIYFKGRKLPRKTEKNWNPLNRPVEFNYKG